MKKNLAQNTEILENNKNGEINVEVMKNPFSGQYMMSSENFYYKPDIDIYLNKLTMLNSGGSVDNNDNSDNNNDIMNDSISNNSISSSIVSNHNSNDNKNGNSYLNNFNSTNNITDNNNDNHNLNNSKINNNDINKTNNDNNNLVSTISKNGNIKNEIIENGISAENGKFNLTEKEEVRFTPTVPRTLQSLKCSNINNFEIELYEGMNVVAFFSFSNGAVEKKNTIIIGEKGSSYVSFEITSSSSSTPTSPSRTQQGSSLIFCFLSFYYCSRLPYILLSFFVHSLFVYDVIIIFFSSTLFYFILFAFITVIITVIITIVMIINNIK